MNSVGTRTKSENEVRTHLMVLEESAIGRHMSVFIF